MGMTVHVFTRHRKNCPHRAKVGYNKCFCPKYAHWSVDGHVHKTTLRTDDLAVALRKASDIENDVEHAGWTGGFTVKRAIEAYLDDKRSQRLSTATVSKLQLLFERQFLSFCEQAGIDRIDQIKLQHIQEWRNTWKDSALTASKKQERIKGFFQFCVRNGYLRNNPSNGLSKIKVTQKPTEYFTDDEFEKIITIAKDARDARYAQRLTALILLMRWSGLAIRDAVTLERSRLNDGDQIMLYRAKTGVPVFVAVPPDVAEELRKVSNENPAYFFWSGKGLPKSAVSDYQRALRKVFKKAGIKGPDGKPRRCHSHMFRNTFSVNLLLVGVPIHDVSLLLGHSSVKTTERHYAPFVMARQENLLDAVRLAWESKGKVEEIKF
jgi:integrase